MTERIFRIETPADYAAAEKLTRQAFWNVYMPGCDEHYILHIMRNDPDAVEALNLVCEQDGQLLGHIFYTRTKVVGPDGEVHPVLSFGPISVRPDVQHTGIGSELIRRSFDLARKLGFGGVIITGNPAYYHRFGFGPASDFGVVMDDGSSFPELMAVELIPGSLKNVSGRMHFAPKFFDIDQKALAEFEKLGEPFFSKKEGFPQPPS